MFIHLPIELWQYILDLSDFKSRIVLRLTCKLLHEQLKIYDFTDCHCKHKLTDEILKSYPFIRKLDASHNYNITNVNHLIHLKVLYAYGSCGIDDNGIKKLDLIKFDAYDNHKITDVGHLTNLRKLDAGSTCGINDNNIKKLNLTKLYANNNSKITNANHPIVSRQPMPIKW